MPDVPEVVFVVKVIGQWPLHVFANESHAVHRYKKLMRENQGRVRIYACNLTVDAEMELVHEREYLTTKERTHV